MWMASLTDTERQGVVPRHQFLMEQAGRARIMRSPTAAPNFFQQNSDQIEPVKPVGWPKRLYFYWQNGWKMISSKHMTISPNICIRYIYINSSRTKYKYDYYGYNHHLLLVYRSNCCSQPEQWGRSKLNYFTTRAHYTRTNTFFSICAQWLEPFCQGYFCQFFRPTFGMSYHQVLMVGHTKSRPKKSAKISLTERL